jgi:hypothetical protein
MFSFGHNSFWNFSFQGSAAVQSLLEKSDLTLDDLLEEDGLLTELKTLNQKLFDFLLTEETFKQLISYVIHEPNPEDIHTNSKRCFKYPFTCADLLGSDSQAILSEFFKSSSEIKEKAAERARKAAALAEDKDDEVNLEDPESAQRTNSTSEESPTSEDKENQIPTNQVENFEFLDYLFTFLDQPSVNYTAAGYFAKIVNNLYAKKPSIFLSYIYESRPDLLEKMVNHISSKSIAEFLAKLLAFESSLLANNDDETYNTERIKILNLVVRKLDPKNDVEMVNNSAYLICETFGKYNTMHCGREVLSSLLTDQTISYFFGILEARNSVSSCAVALILGNIFAYYILISTSRNYDGESQEYYSQSPTMGELKDDLPLIVALLGHIPSIIDYLGENQGSSITNQCGTNIIPFGGAKLKLIELLIIALKTGNQKIHAKLAQAGFVETLLELFLRFEWNNMLHNQVEKVLTFIIEGNSEELKVTLFEKADILTFLINATRQSEYDMSGKHGRKVRKGYMGQVVRLSNKIIESRDDYIMNFTNYFTAWKEYVNAELAETNKKDKINLGGRDPRGHFQDDDDDYDNMDQHDPLNSYYGSPDDNDKTFGKDYQDQDQYDDKDEDEDKENDDEDDEDDDVEPRNLRDSYSRLSGVQILHKAVDDDDEEIEEEVVVVDDDDHCTSEYQVVHVEEESAYVPHVEAPKKEAEVKIVELKEEERVKEEKLDNEYSPSVFFKVDSSVSLEDIMNEFQ